MAENLYSQENEVFSGFLWYGALLLLKMLFMSVFTSYNRMRYGALPSREDLVLLGNDHEKRKKALLPNEHVERVRTCHRNDIENVFAFLFISALYIGTNPEPATALLYFKVFTASRFGHTIVYLNAIPQPARFLCFTVGYVCSILMAVSILSSLW